MNLHRTSVVSWKSIRRRERALNVTEGGRGALDPGEKASVTHTHTETGTHLLGGCAGGLPLVLRAEIVHAPGSTKHMQIGRTGLVVSIMLRNWVCEFSGLPN